MHNGGAILLLCTYIAVFRLDVLALSVIATATWLGGWRVAGWLAGCHTPVLYQNGWTYLKTFSTIC